MSDRTINESTYREVVEALTNAWRFGYFADRIAMKDELRAALATLQGLSPAQATLTDEQILACNNCAAEDQEFTPFITAPDEDLIAFARAILARAAIQAALPRGEEPPDYAPPLDDQGRMMRGTDHHYTVESIQARIAQLRRFADPEQSTQAEWDNLDWRGFCNTTRHIMSGLYAAIEPVRATPPLAPSVVAGEATALQALDALDALEGSARGDEPFNHAAAPLIRAYIEASIATPPAAAGAAIQGWQPIETAPKGRTLLVGYTNRAGKWRTVRGHYYLPQTLELGDDYDGDAEDGFAPDGWYEEVENSETINFTDEPPTHWMPLPAGPTASSGD